MDSAKDPRTYAIIGAALEVHRQLGNGFLEAVYQEALAIELRARRIGFQKEADLPVFYKGLQLRCGYRADFVCFDGVVAEIKALRALSGCEEAQVINYLQGVWSQDRSTAELRHPTPGTQAIRPYTHRPKSAAICVICG